MTFSYKQKLRELITSRPESKKCKRVSFRLEGKDSDSDSDSNLKLYVEI